MSVKSNVYIHSRKAFATAGIAEKRFFETLTAPRGIYAMDEYVIDVELRVTRLSAHRPSTKTSPATGLNGKLLNAVS